MENIVKGFINWQGVLNNAQRLRGEKIFLDLFDYPHRYLHLFDVVCETMIQACRKIHEQQSKSGFIPGFFVR